MLTPLLLNLTTVYERVTLGVQPRPLGKGKIVAVVVQNTFLNVNVGLTGNNVTVMIGDESAQVHELIPGQISQVLYVDDLEQLYGRVQSGATEVAVTLIVYKEREGR